MKRKIVSVFSTAFLIPGLLGAVPTFATTESPNSSTALTSHVHQKPIEVKKSDTKISKEKAAEIAKGFMTIPSGYKQTNISFNTNWYPNQRSVWQIIWEKSDDKATGHIDIVVDANSGDVLAADSFENNPDHQQAYPPKVNYEKAVKIAKAYIVDQFPQTAKAVTYEDQSSNRNPPLKGNVYYTLRFVQTVNTIPFEDNYISVTVDGDGAITGMNYQWNNNLSFPRATGLISNSEALLKMKALPLQLRYLTLYDAAKPFNSVKEAQPKIELTYQNIENITMLDAITGKWYDSQGNILDALPTNRLTPLSDKPLASPPSLRTELTQDQAENELTKQLDIPTSLQMQNAYYNDNWGLDHDSVWRFNWNKDNKIDISATINAKTGEILDYNLYDPEIYQPYPSNDDWSPSVTYDQAKQKAIDEIKRLVPYKLDQLVFDTTENLISTNPSQQRVYPFHFQRIIHGVVDSNQSINIGINASNGDMINFYQNWSDQHTFPSPKDAVTAEQAKQPYFDNFTFNLVYKLIQTNYKGKTNQAEPLSEPKIILVYEMRQKDSEQPVYFDAKKNQWLFQINGEQVYRNTKAVDISGSWAEKPLQLMIDYGALTLDKNSKVYPEKAITRGQMVKMLMLATNPDPIYYEKAAQTSGNKAFSDVSADSPYYNYIQVAVQNGWIDSKQKTYKPNSLVTREELADLIIHALNYDELADLKGLFQLDFKDNNKITKKGDVAIVSHLGIMNGSNGYFHPQKIATRAEAAVAFYRFLNKQGEYGK